MAQVQACGHCTASSLSSSCGEEQGGEGLGQINLVLCASICALIFCNCKVHIVLFFFSIAAESVCVCVCVCVSEKNER